jgi:hypothetical protein
MGIKTTMAGLTYAANHVAAAQRSSQSVQSLHVGIQLQSIELLRNLNLLLSTMQAGDPNIATVQAQITALS